MTRSNADNIAFSNLEIEMKENDGEAVIKKEKEVAACKETKKKSKVRGRKIFQYCQYDFIAREIEKTIGIRQRAENIFNYRQTSTKAEKNLEKETEPKTIRAKLSKKKNTGVGGYVDDTI